MLKKISVLFLTSVCTEAFAVAPGLYLGVGTGPASNGGSTVQVQSSVPPPETLPNYFVTIPANPEKKQWGTTIFAGYKMNNYAGVELGLSIFNKINYNTTTNIDPCAPSYVRVRTLDLVGVGSFELGGFELFGKGGIGVVYTATSGALNAVKGTCGQNSYSNAFRPVFAIGGGYDLNQNWVASATWTRFFVGGSINYVDFYALNISYHFVDIYCGQFLCDSS